MPFTAEELEAMRLADEEIEHEFEESYSAQYADAGISKWLDELAINDTLDPSSYIKSASSAPTAKSTRMRSRPRSAPTTKSTRMRSRPSSVPTVSGNASKNT